MKPLIPAILTAFVAAAAHASEPIILADFEEKKAPPAPTITGHWSKSDPGEVPELVLQTASPSFLDGR
ncbi:MAG: hypothetical protein WCK77_15230 [Verrucomicrobiota bacterium]